MTAIVIFAAYRIGSRALKNGLLWTMAALAFLAIFLLDAPFPLIVLVAAILGGIGGIGGKWAPQKFAVGGGHGAAKHSYGPALIDDDTPPPAHARFSWRGVLKVVLTGLVMWSFAIGYLSARYGWSGALTQMG
ncbi:MAG: chromate efflux transporter, partial [Methylosarcina sp.]